MKWCEEIEQKLRPGNIYSHKEIVEELRKLNSDVSDSTYHWALRVLVNEGRIKRLGYDAYTVSNTLSKEEYHPCYSVLAEELINKIDKKFPYVKFTIFETVMMNDFLNHLIAQNTVFIQAEKDSGIFLFRYLQEEGYHNVLYKPKEKEFNLYWEKDAIVIIDLVTEAPLRQEKPHAILLEKLLVDMISDKLISETYSQAEFGDVVNQTRSQYYLDRTRLLRYARRRNKEKLVKQYLEGNTLEHATA